LLLRDGRLHRAQDLADKLEVSVRTIYRDMDTLVLSGVPVAGERGIGYMMTAPITHALCQDRRRPARRPRHTAHRLGLCRLPVSGRRSGLSVHAANPQGDPVAPEVGDRV